MSPTEKLSLKQIKLISIINNSKSAFWRVTHAVVDGQFVISIKSHASIFSDIGRLLAEITLDEENNCLLVKYAIDSGRGEQSLINYVLTHRQALPVELI